MKLAGRDAGKLGAVVDISDNNYVIIDGFVRRRKCNVRHLEFLDAEIKIKKNAATEDVVNAMKSLGAGTAVKKGKRKDRKERPKKLRKQKEKETKEPEKKKEKK